jgi:hypothetical protein
VIGWFRLKGAGSRQPVEQQVKIHHAGVRLPAFDHPAHAGVVQWSRTLKPSGQSLLSAHVIAGKRVQASNAAQQHVLGRPPADATDL